ncbi:MAG: radical SAM/SPASM domain-containing protein [Candidatus Heimdallarchaeota archaeon]
MKWRVKEIFYLLRKRKFKMAYNYVWVSLFTSNSGLNLLDPLYRIFPDFVPYPKTIEVEITTKCHLKCTICEHTYWKEPPRDMSFEEFKKIIDQFLNLKWIGITGIGSGFLNKDYMKMLRYLKSKSIYVEFFDTFTQIDENMARELVEIGIDKIYLSIDAATKETYEKIRVGANFDKVLNNVRALLRAKKELGSPVPELWFHYIVTKMNVYEMPKFLELVHSLKADETGGTLVYWSDLLAFKEVRDLVVKIPEEVKCTLVKKSRELGIEMWWNPNVAPSEPITKCVGWTEPFILVTGHVQPCCVINEANQRDFQKKNAVGNLFEKPFSEIWNNEYKKLRQMIRQGKVPEICKYCRVFKMPHAHG